MHPFIRKLSLFASFSREEEHALELALGSTFQVPARQDFARQDDPPSNGFILLEGFATRSKMSNDGRRQILAYMIPGDLCDVGLTLLERRDHTLTALTPCRVAQIPDATLQHLMQQYPRIAAAVRWATLVEQAVSREWLLNVGQRRSLRRMAHLFCELYYRLHAIGRTDGFNFELPLTQLDLADILGMSVVHANRTLQDLRRLKLIAFGDNRLTILDLDRLEASAGLDPSYLHLTARYQDHPGRTGGRGLIICEGNSLGAAMRIPSQPKSGSLARNFSTQLFFASEVLA